MKRIKLVFVGDMKAPHFAQALRHYLEALERACKVEHVIVRDAREMKDPGLRCRKEGQAILAALGPKDMAVGLDEGGKAYTSKTLAARLNRCFEDPGRTPCFVVGGPFGFSPEATARFDERLSLGPYTLPHELARVVLLEQLFRATCILSGHPYHHD